MFLGRAAASPHFRLLLLLQVFDQHVLERSNEITLWQWLFFGRLRLRRAALGRLLRYRLEVRRLRAEDGHCRRVAPRRFPRHEPALPIFPSVPVVFGLGRLFR